MCVASGREIETEEKELKRSKSFEWKKKNEGKSDTSCNCAYVDRGWCISHTIHGTLYAKLNCMMHSQPTLAHTELRAAHDSCNVNDIWQTGQRSWLISRTEIIYLAFISFAAAAAASTAANILRWLDSSLSGISHFNKWKSSFLLLSQHFSVCASACDWCTIVMIYASMHLNSELKNFDFLFVFRWRQCAMLIECIHVRRDEAVCMATISIYSSFARHKSYFEIIMMSSRTKSRMEFVSCLHVDVWFSVY